MLQINSGKLYPNGVHRTNELRGVLYTNLLFLRIKDEPIITAAGRLLQADAFGTPRLLVYEVTEQFEHNIIAPGVLMSHTVQPYMQDFGAVVSFILRAICIPDADECTRLLSGKRSLGVVTPPEKLVRRVFDKEIGFQQSDAELLKSFIADLIALKRKSFLAAMRAIRTYVTGLHRMADDLELAYTLLVASIESLAQDFDAHKAKWNDYEQSKRNRIDKALANADDVTAKRVRTAILEGEHLALARRFREFVLAHLPDSDFYEGGRTGAPGRLDLRDALKEAYDLRSRYVHSLRDLPRLLDTNFLYSETIRSGHATYLTLEGLSRIARRVIIEFVARQPKCEAEVYDYHLERYGIRSAELASQHWIGRPELLEKGKARKFLSALLGQLATLLISKKPINDLHQLCAKIEDTLAGLRGEDRKACAAIYILFNCALPPDQRSERFIETHKKCEKTLEGPSIEALCLRLMFGSPPRWSPEEQKATLENYFERRNQKSGFRVPELFEAGMTLSLAERYRAVGQPDVAKSLLAFAVDNALQFPILVSLRDGFDPEVPIDWRVLLPEGPPNSNREGAPCSTPSPVLLMMGHEHGMSR